MSGRPCQPTYLAPRPTPSPTPAARPTYPPHRRLPLAAHPHPQRLHPRAHIAWLLGLALPCPARPRHSWGHGGAGIVLSVGLMQAIAGGPAEACAMAKAVHSCDMNLALCLQQSGFMFTQAGYSIGHGASWSDPRFIVFDNPIHRYALKDPLGVLQGRVECAGEPDPHRHCRWLLAHAVSVHMQARGYAGIADAAGAMRAVARQHRKAMRQLKAEHAAGAVGMPGTGAGAGNGSHGGAGRAGAAEGG